MTPDRRRRDEDYRQDDRCDRYRDDRNDDYDRYRYDDDRDDRYDRRNSRNDRRNNNRNSRNNRRNNDNRRRDAPPNDQRNSNPLTHEAGNQSQPQTDRAETSNSVNVTCFKGNQPGHYATQCPTTNRGKAPAVNNIMVDVQTVTTWSKA